MKLGIMQPYFFPYLGYFDLINRVDQWVVFDVVKFAHKTWMSRNRILHPSEGWQYVTLPIDKHSGNGKVSEVEVIAPKAARDKILGQLRHYRPARAPYYDAVCDLVETAFGVDGGKLCDVNVAGLAAVCAYLDIPFEDKRLSNLNLTLPEITHAGQWAAEISAALGAEEYINPPGGRAIFNEEEFRAKGIRLRFTPLIHYSYDVKTYDFVEHLSVLDVLMWNAPADVKAHLDQIKRDEETISLEAVS